MLYYLETTILIIFLSLDTIIAGISMGIEKIKVTLLSSIILNTISTLFLIVSCYVGKYIIEILPSFISCNLSSFLFIILGINKLIEYLKESKSSQSKNIIIKIFKEPTLASEIDLDNSKTLSIKELILLASALSIDNLIIGLGITNNILVFIILHFIIGIFLFIIFNRLFFKISFFRNINSSLLSSVIFIIIGIYHLF